ncbi:chemotaxis protein histidine kinase CheA [Humitalea rosea]|uniref:Chemotaxis protein CheA n=1 Tax=Humitalea rosea TaxID=990373 RepID=A0A2W7IJV5_9PROT|nr:ATP-binding protein [Humitalea rosea]PZW46992.1 chemotaxis protein histidine kinase CheA [Humitalea rosea]
MSDRTELLEQFAIETQQHIDEIEPILLAAEWDAPDKPAISALFRCFHSVKGLARLLELHGLEALSHHAESLLGDVRAGRLPFTAAIQDGLLRALDELRGLRELGIAAGQDRAASPAVIATLQRLADAAAGPAAAAAERPALHADAEMLAYYAELLAECLPGLAVLVTGIGDADTALDDLDALMTGAERLALHGLHHRLARLTETGPAPLLDRLAEVILAARRFGELVGQPTGAELLAEALAPALGTALAEAASALDRDWAQPAARRLLRLSQAMAPGSDAAALLLQAADHAGTPVAEAGRRLARLLAEQPAGDGVSDLAALGAEALRQAMLARSAPAAGLAELLAQRGVDPQALAAIGPAARARLDSLLEGGTVQLLAVTASLPPDPTAFLGWLAETYAPVLAQPGSQGGVALLIVSDQTGDAICAAMLAREPGLASVAAHRLDGQFLLHPWAPAATSATRRATDAAENQVRVPVELLDRLFGRVGEFFNVSGALNVLVLDSEVPRTLQRLSDHIVQHAPWLLPALDVLQRQQAELAQIEAETHRLISLIHEATLGLRVIPLDILFNRFPRMVRELAREQGKQIRFEVQSEDIKVDKGMTELLGDPLMHILRNAIDHGVETAEDRRAGGKPPVARVSLSATQNASRIKVTVTDDGRGLDAERIRQVAVAQNLTTEADSHTLSKDQIYRFIFAPGFSTAKELTTTSGRGVGMDVALVNISRLGGKIDIRTVPAQGTTIVLDMPLTAAMQTVLLAETGVQTVAFPERMVVEAVTVARNSVQLVNGQRALLLHDRFLPVFRLTDLLRLPQADGAEAGEDMSLIVVAASQSRYGVEVGRILRRHEMLIRETHPRIAQLPGIGGVSTLGTDRIVLVVDPEGLTELARGAALPGLRSAVRVPA